MRCLMKYEWYKLRHDKLFWIITMLIMLINGVMFAGQDISVDLLAQKLFLTIVIASLYGTSFMAKDYEDRKILYEISSGNRKSKILLAKAAMTIVCIEIQLLIFPLCIIPLVSKSEYREYKIFLVLYVLLGVFLTLLSAFFAIVAKNQGISIGVTIIFHLITLLSVNSSSIGLLMAHILPVGATKLVLGNLMTLDKYFFMLLLWDVVLLLLSLICIQKAEF